MPLDIEVATKFFGQLGLVHTTRILDKDILVIDQSTPAGIDTSVASETYSGGLLDRQRTSVKWRRPRTNTRIMEEIDIDGKGLSLEVRPTDLCRNSKKPNTGFPRRLKIKLFSVPVSTPEPTRSDHPNAQLIRGFIHEND